jgi:hypothetical protein
LLGSNWQRVLTVIKPLEGVVNGVLALALLVVVVWLGRRLWRRRGRGDRG